LYKKMFINEADVAPAIFINLKNPFFDNLGES